MTPPLVYNVVDASNRLQRRQMNAREERGLVIAAMCKLNQAGDAWLVPSQSGERIYQVNVRLQTCTCPDHQEGGFKCKHLYAVEFTIKREVNPDGTVTDTKSVTFTQKTTYTQNWPAYNLAQTTEKHRFQELLFDLCERLAQPPRVPGRVGRNPVLFSDALFAIGCKIYGTLSSRRSMCDLADAHDDGYLSRRIHYNSVNAYLENPEVTPILKAMIARSALPLRAVDRDFAIDSTGFTSSKFVRWFDHKYGVTRQKHTWVKAHFATGVKSNVVTAVRILDRDAADSPQFPDLTKDTAKGGFTIDEMSADKAYASLENFEAVADCGGTGFIAFKSNHTGAVGGLFEKMYHYYQFRQEEYMAHYHKRSNAESTVSMVKRKFGDHVRSRSDTAMVNEVLAKFLCHNLCVVIMSQCELGIEAIFWPEEPADPERNEIRKVKQNQALQAN
jgi:transposase